MAISYIASASTDAASGNISFTHGLTIAAGDVLIATVNVNGDANTVTDDNGATPFTARHSTASLDSATFCVFDRVAGASEPAAYAFTLGASNRWSIVIRQYRGVHASVWDVAPAAGTVATGQGDVFAVAASISILTGGACGLVLMGDDYTPTTTAYASVNNSYGNAKAESGQQYQATADKLGLATGATGPTTLTSDAEITYVIYQVALKPAAGAQTEAGAANVTVTATATIGTIGKKAAAGAGTVTVTATATAGTIATRTAAGAAGFAVTASGTLVTATVAAVPATVDISDYGWRVVAGSDGTGWRDITEDVSGLTYSKVRPGGAASASFTVPADVWGIGYNEVRADQQVVVSYAGHTVWDGVVLPRGISYAGDAVDGQPPITVEATGMLARAKRRKDYARVFADADLGQWYQAEWETLSPGIVVTRPGDLVFAAASGSVFPADSYQAVWYWLHQGLVTDQDIDSVQFAWTSLGTMTWEVFEASEASASASWVSIGSGGGTTRSSPTAVNLTCSVGTRALAIRCGWAAGATPSFDNRIRFSRLQVMGQSAEATIGTALESVLVTPGIADSFYSASLWSAGGTTPPPPIPPTGSISVKDAPYNAAGDGVTDDYAAILAALNAVDGTTTALYFPDGRYYIGDHTSGSETYANDITFPDDVEVVGESATGAWIYGRVVFGSDSKVSYIKLGCPGHAAVFHKDGADSTDFYGVRFTGGGALSGTQSNAPVIWLGGWRDCSNISFYNCVVECNGGTEDASLSRTFNNVSIYADNGEATGILFDHCTIGVSNGTRSGSPRMGLECFTESTSTKAWGNITLRYTTIECCDAHCLNFSDDLAMQSTGIIVDHCTLKGGGLAQINWGATLVLELGLSVTITNNELWDGWEFVIQQYQRAGYDDPQHVFQNNVIDLTKSNGIERAGYWAAVTLEGSSNVYPTTGVYANTQVGS